MEYTPQPTGWKNVYGAAEVEANADAEEPIGDAKIDPYVYHFTTDNLPPLNIQRNEWAYPNNGHKNVYAEQKPDIAARNLDPNVFDFVSGDPVVPHNAYEYTRPTVANSHNGWNNVYAAAQENNEDSDSEDSEGEEEQ